MTDDWRTDRIGSALRGENPTVLRRLTAGFAVIGDVQFLPGYSVLLADDPAVDRLSDLPRAKRLDFLSDMDRLGVAVERACGRADLAFLRVNLEILGNTDGFLHAHVWPRYAWEPADLVRLPVWLHPPGPVERPAVRPRPGARRAARGDRGRAGPDRPRYMSDRSTMSRNSALGVSSIVARCLRRVRGRPATANSTSPAASQIP